MERCSFGSAESFEVDLSVSKLITGGSFQFISNNNRYPVKNGSEYELMHLC